MTLEGHGDRCGRPVPILCDNEVGLARSRRLAVVGVLSVQQYHKVRQARARASATLALG
jgi:hypothetical protein